MILLKSILQKLATITTKVKKLDFFATVNRIKREKRSWSRFYKVVKLQKQR